MAVISEARPPNSGNPNPTGFARWWERTTNTRAAYLYLVPAFIVMAFITFYPMLYQVGMSFTDFGIKNKKSHERGHRQVSAFWGSGDFN